MSDYTILPSGIQILTTTPSGEGGVVLNENFSLVDTAITEFNAYVANPEDNPYTAGNSYIVAEYADATTIGSTPLFTVPTGTIALIDSFSVMTISNPSPGAAPFIVFGTAGTPNLFVTSMQLPAQSPYDRYRIENPTNGIAAGTVISGSVVTASTATSGHTIQYILSLYLLVAPA